MTAEYCARPIRQQNEKKKKRHHVAFWGDRITGENYTIAAELGNG